MPENAGALMDEIALHSASVLCSRAVMKIRYLVPLLLLPAAAGFGQQQEQKLMDRMLKPDLQRGNFLQGKAYQADGGMVLRSSSESQATYSGAKDAYMKDFPYSRSFLGIKNPWFGGKVYDTKKADDWASRQMADGDRKVAVRDAVVSGYYQEDKQMNYGSPVVPVREFIPKGATEGAVNQITEKISKDMTIDQVREILNKSR